MVGFAVEYAKSFFSATESFLFQLKEAYVAVRDVLKLGLQEEALKSSGDNGISKDIDKKFQVGIASSQETESGKSAFSINLCFLPIARTVSRKCYSDSEEKSNCCTCMKSVICTGTCFCTYAKSQYFYQTLVVAIPLLLIFYVIWIYYDDYFSNFLTLFEEMDTELAVAVFMLMFIIACLPLVWGYVLLNLAAGYRFGVVYGVFLVMMSVSLGLALTHKISQKLCAGCIMKSLKCYNNKSRIEAILKVLDGSKGLKVVALTRLTPIPFGLQNGIFAMSDIKTRHYVAASNIGLLPTQVLNCYIGSTFRSAEDVVAHGGSFSGYVIFFTQLAIGVLLMAYVVRHAGKELNNVLNSSITQEKTIDSLSNEHQLQEVKVTQPASVEIL